MVNNFKSDNMFLMLLNSIDGAKSAIVSIMSAVISLFIGEVSKTSVIAEILTPNWFTIISPYLQAGAWIVAILAGLVTLYKACMKDKKRNNNEKTTTLP